MVDYNIVIEDSGVRLQDQVARSSGASSKGQYAVSQLERDRQRDSRVSTSGLTVKRFRKLKSSADLMINKRR